MAMMQRRRMEFKSVVSVALIVAVLLVFLIFSHLCLGNKC